MRASNGHGCNTLTGSFNVLAADFGAYNLSQALKGQQPASDTGSIGLYDCSTTPTPWAIVVMPTDPKKPLRKGTASASVNAHIKDAYHDIEADTEPVPATVTLKEG